MRKLTARCVTKCLSDEQMAIRASVSSKLLRRFRSKGDDFLSRLVTVDETWVHYYELENNAWSLERVVPGSSKSKKLKIQSPADKAKIIVFWNAKVIILLEVLPKESTISGEKCAIPFDQWESQCLKKDTIDSLKMSTTARFQWLL